jgi:hypothetical protein
MTSAIIFVRDFAVSVAVGTILLLLLTKLIGRVQFSLNTAIGCSFIGHGLLSIIGFLLAFAFASQPAVGAIIGFILGCFVLAILFQIPVRATNETLTRWRAVILAVIVILGTFS